MSANARRPPCSGTSPWPSTPGRDESGLNGARRGHLAELFERAGIGGIVEAVLPAEVDYASFEEWWEPYTLGVGPAGAHLASLDQVSAEALRAGCHDVLGPGPFTVSAHAWAVAATTPVG